MKPQPKKPVVKKQEPQQIPVNVQPMFFVDAEKIESIEDVKKIFAMLGVTVAAQAVQGSGIEHLVDTTRFANSREDKMYSIAAVMQFPLEALAMRSDREIDALYLQALAVLEAQNQPQQPPQQPQAQVLPEDAPTPQQPEQAPTAAQPTKTWSAQPAPQE